MTLLLLSQQTGQERDGRSLGEQVLELLGRNFDGANRDSATLRATYGPLGLLANNGARLLLATVRLPQSQRLGISTDARIVVQAAEEMCGQHQRAGALIGAIDEFEVAIFDRVSAQPPVDVGQLRGPAREVLQGHSAGESLLDETIDDQNVRVRIFRFAIGLLVPEGVRMQRLRWHQVAAFASAERAPRVPADWTSDWAVSGRFLNG